MMRIDMAPPQPQQDKLWATAAFVLGLGEGAVMLPEHLEELVEYMASATAIAAEAAWGAAEAAYAPFGSRSPSTRPPHRPTAPCRPASRPRP